MYLYKIYVTILLLFTFKWVQEYYIKTPNLQRKEVIIMRR